MEILGITCIRTIAYHPIANGIVERFHHQLKAPLKSYSNPNHWVSSLPMVLLGIQTAIKTDLGCSVAGLVYGTTLRIPGKVFVSDKTTPTNLAYFVLHLKAVPKHTDATHHKDCAHHNLSTCTHVFMRHDTVRKPLQVPYDRPCKLLKRSNKHSHWT